MDDCPCPCHSLDPAHPCTMCLVEDDEEDSDDDEALVA